MLHDGKQPQGQLVWPVGGQIQAIAATTGALFVLGNHIDYKKNKRTGTIAARDGNTLKVQHTLAGLTLQDIAARSATDATAVGEKGTVLRYDGSSWTEDKTAPGTSQLDAVWLAPSSQVIHAVGDDGAALRFDGAAWSPVATGTGADLFALGALAPASAGGAHQVYAISNVGSGSALFRYTDGIWRKLSLPDVPLSPIYLTPSLATADDTISS